MRRSLLASLVASLVILSPASVGATTDLGGWIHRRDEQPPLIDAETFIIQGVPRPDGSCEFADPELVVPDGAVAIERRDLAFDLTLCRKLVEEGTPTTPSPLADLDEFALVEGQSASMAATAAATYWKKAYHQVYWTDAAGAMVNGMETHLKWFYGSGCAYYSTGYTGMYGYAPSGWYMIQQPSFRQYGTCSVVTSSGDNGIVGNTYVCGREVRTYYYYVRVHGYSSGTVGGTYSTDTTNECLPLFSNRRVVVYDSGSGSPQ